MLPVQHAPLLRDVDHPHLQTDVHGCDKHLADLVLVVQEGFVVSTQVDLRCVLTKQLWWPDAFD